MYTIVDKRRILWYTFFAEYLSVELQPVKNEKGGVIMAVASLVLGIISLVIALFFSAFGWLGAILGILGIVFAALARKKQKTGIATAGLVLSIIGTILGLLLYIACVACVGGLAGALNAV